MTMGLNVIKFLKEHPEVYQKMTETAIRLEEGFYKNLEALNIKNVTINRVGGMICQFFAKSPVDSYDQVMKANTEQYADYFRYMLEEGILLPPAQYECMFLSTEHNEELINRTIEAHHKSMKRVKSKWKEI